MRATLLRDVRTQYANPIGVHRGDVVQLGERDTEWPAFAWTTTADGNAGWAPADWLRPLGDGTAEALRDYTARELDGGAGDTVELIDELGGWWWSRAADGREGWLPANALRIEPTPKGQKLSLAAKLAGFSEHWSPRVVAEMNDVQFKLAKLSGEFVWHAHADTDEVFIVVAGTLRMRFRDREERLGAGEMIVVPRGVEHCPVADDECHVMLVEPRGVVNTGDAGGALTAANDVWA
jgi:mannose-6-phosphate isomerase-like protein (cupin superfamily)